jgi:PPK2 family polyphosphate:nucleotide phosphotransferase
VKPLAPIAADAEPTLSDADAAVSEPPPDHELHQRLSAATERLDELQRALYAEGTRGVLVVLQGRDTSGKDGTVRHVFGPLNPQGVVVRSFRAPTAEELKHDFLWRIHQAVGPRGVITIFNRSQYEDVLAVRVHGLVPESVWRRRFDQINRFEQLLTESGYRVLKFFLHISRSEQKHRLEERLDDPKKNWKFQVGDLAERALWDDYTLAYREALARCSTAAAPWYLVPADEKGVRNVLIAECVLRAVEELDPRFPAARPEVLAQRHSFR